MRATAILRTADPFQWLNSLKNDQLRQISRLIGSNSTGKKSLLLQRLKRDLSRSEYRAYPSRIDKSGIESREMRVLSIDMGIRNLAYAHFVVPLGADSKSREDDSMLQKKRQRQGQRQGQRPIPFLTDWRRLSVEQILSLEDQKNGNLGQLSNTQSQTKSECPSARDSGIEGTAETEADEAASEIQNPSITSEPYYARHAYNFISALLTKHNPTHILIERQRLRSSGSPNVFQSVLGVAMFEVQIHASLYTMLRERGLEVYTQAVDPAMVVGCLGGLVADQFGGDQYRPHEIKAWNMADVEKNPKRARVDLVGRWLSSWARDEGFVDESPGDIHDATPADRDPDQAPASGNHTGKLRSHNKIRIGDDSRIRQFALAYLEEWQRSVMRRRPRDTCSRNTRGEKTGVPARLRGEFGLHKLDDLADCLVQGLVWLDWHIMRDKVAREGLDALGWIDVLEKKGKRK